MNDTPLFTVATLCYNHSPYLDDYFRGLLSQTYSNVQLIIHDDCSDDGSWEKIQAYLPEVREKFVEVICERSETNLGMWGAYLKVSDPSRIRGKYLSFLESDDYYLPERIERCVEVLEANPAAGLVHSATLHVWDAENRTVEYRPNHSEVSGSVFERLLRVNFINQCSIAFRYSIFASVDVKSISGRGYKLIDYAVNLKVAQIAPVVYIDEVLAVYRIHKGSASRPLDKVKQYEFGKSVNKVPLDAAKDAGISADFVHLLASKYHYSVFRSATPIGHFDDAKASLDWLTKNDPQRVRSLPDKFRAVMLANKATRFILKYIYFSSLFIRLRQNLHTVLESGKSRKSGGGKAE